MMRRGFSFVHAADLHLDSPFKGLTAQAPAVARALQDATFIAFDNIVRLCLNEQPDFLVVAGDVYDGAERSVRAQLRFRDGLARLSARGVRSFVAFGNHDHLGGWSPAVTWPEHVHVFGPDIETVIVRREGEPIAAVSGVSYPHQNEQRNLAKLLAAAPLPGGVGTDVFRLAVLHANVGGRPGHDNYAPCDVVDLGHGPFAYWALGHVHSREVLCEHPYAAYPGNPQGRHANELGARGCLLVTVDDDGAITAEFHALDAVRWASVDVSIDGLAGINVLEDRMATTVEQMQADADGRPVIVRLRVTGRGPLFRELRRGQAIADLLNRLRERHGEEEPFAWVEQIEVACRPEVDLTRRATSPDLLGEVLRVRDEFRTESLEGLRAVLAELYDNGRVRRALDSTPSDEEMQHLLDEAALLCVDGLEPAE
jgi:DNA repair exonuclease SbcCD nuclease subunit